MDVARQGSGRCTALLQHNMGEISLKETRNFKASWCARGINNVGGGQVRRAGVHFPDPAE
ncbi:hypothetical protein ABBQ38_006056 [Trebouxia sp. C0009 RCD-2024]